MTSVLGRASIAAANKVGDLCRCMNALTTERGGFGSGLTDRIWADAEVANVARPVPSGQNRQYLHASPSAV